MKKLKLEDLDVATFTTVEVREDKGTVIANDASTTDTCWDCSHDICSHLIACGPTVGLSTNTYSN